VSGVEVEGLPRQVGEPKRLFGDAGQDGVALAEEGVEGTAEAIIIELVGGDVPEEVGTRLRCPLRMLTSAVGRESRAANSKLRMWP